MHLSTLESGIKVYLLHINDVKFFVWRYSIALNKVLLNSYLCKNATLLHCCSLNKQPTFGIFFSLLIMNRAAYAFE